MFNRTEWMTGRRRRLLSTREPSTCRLLFPARCCPFCLFCIYLIALLANSRRLFYFTSSGLQQRFSYVPPFFLYSTIFAQHNNIFRRARIALLLMAFHHLTKIFFFFLLLLAAIIINKNNTRWKRDATTTTTKKKRRSLITSVAAAARPHPHIQPSKALNYFQLFFNFFFFSLWLAALVPILTRISFFKLYFKIVKNKQSFIHSFWWYTNDSTYECMREF